MAEEPAEAHGGPWPVRGTLTSDDRQLIYDEFGVSAAVRWRVQWDQRCLTVNGPVNQLAAAKARALELIAANGDDGGRAEDTLSSKSGAKAPGKGSGGSPPAKWGGSPPGKSVPGKGNAAKANVESKGKGKAPEKGKAEGKGKKGPPAKAPPATRPNLGDATAAVMLDMQARLVRAESMLETQRSELAAQGQQVYLLTQWSQGMGMAMAGMYAPPPARPRPDLQPAEARPAAPAEARPAEPPAPARERGRKRRSEASPDPAEDEEEEDHGLRNHNSNTHIIGCF